MRTVVNPPVPGVPLRKSCGSSPSDGINLVQDNCNVSFDAFRRRRAINLYAYLCTTSAKVCYLLHSFLRRVE